VREEEEQEEQEEKKEDGVGSRTRFCNDLVLRPQTPRIAQIS